MQRVTSDQNQSMPTPKSTKKEIHYKKLKEMNIEVQLQRFKTFVLGISGGDCAGKWEMIQYMFEKKEDQWIFKQTGQPVVILRQGYFVNDEDGKKYSAVGTNWDQFYKKALHLLIGNDVDIIIKKNGKEDTLKLKSAKLLVIEGAHIFMSNQDTHNVSSLINLKVFIDSDSDVRLSRRVFQDTQENNKELNWSVTNYLEYIKPSYERQIEPTKQLSDIIIPHFGGGFNDHKKNHKQYDSNIKNACSLILTHLKQEMKRYEQNILEA